MHETLDQVKMDYRAQVNCNCDSCNRIVAKVEALLDRAYEAGKNAKV